MSTAWVVGLLFSMLIEPEPAAGAAEPAWVVAAGVLLLGAIVMTLTGLAMRMRWGAVASLGAASILTAGVIACPVTGHHALGTWWVAQLAVAAGLLALSGSAILRRSD